MIVIDFVVSALIVLIGVFMLLPIFGVVTPIEIVRPYLGIILIILGALLAYANLTSKIE